MYGAKLSERSVLPYNELQKLMIPLEVLHTFKKLFGAHSHWCQICKFCEISHWLIHTGVWSSGVVTAAQRPSSPLARSKSHILTGDIWTTNSNQNTTLPKPRRIYLMPSHFQTQPLFYTILSHKPKWNGLKLLEKNVKGTCFWHCLKFDSIKVTDNKSVLPWASAVCILTG